MATFVESLVGLIDMLKRVDAEGRKAIPAGIPVASQYGDLTGAHCEVEIGRRSNPVPAIATAAFDYFHKLASSNQFGNRGR